MQFSVKDLVYISVYLISVIGMLYAMKYRVKKVEDSNEILKNIIFRDKGGLNVVDNQSCKDHRDLVYQKIRDESGVTQRAFENIDCINQNIFKIMVHMKLKPIVFERKIIRSDRHGSSKG